MPLEQSLGIDPRRRWLSLEALVDSLLADAIAADARFQLTQAAAWKDFTAQLNRRGAALGAADLAAGWGRQANLGLDQLSLELILEVYRPPWWRRVWGWLMGLLGRSPVVKPARYRLATARGRGYRLKLMLLASRSADGRWQVQSERGAAA